MQNMNDLLFYGKGLQIFLLIIYNEYINTNLITKIRLWNVF